jgi:hypothetical protein
MSDDCACSPTVRSAGPLTVRAYFERVQRDDPQRQKIALVATAHYLVRAMWAMLRHGTAWRESATRVA